jgi:NitT/TauT family transport system substrate-binding protein
MPGGLLVMNFSGRFLAFAAAALLTAAGLPRPAAADDTLTVISGSAPTAFFEVIGDVAQYAGFYKQQHLDVEIQYAGSPNIAAQLVASGKGDVCSISLEPIIAGYEKGLHLEAFFARDPHYEYALGVPADSPIKTLADFKGTTIGEYSVSSPAEISVTSMLQGAGLKKSDFSFIPIGSGAQAISALNSKKVAGAAFPYVELALYESNAGQKYRFFFHPILKDIGDVGYTSTPATIAAKADLLRRFARANAKASILIRVNPQLAARYFLQGAGLKVTDETLRNQTTLLQLAQDQLPGFDPTNKRIGEISARDMTVLTKFLAAAGFTTQVVPVSAISTSQFIDYANDFDHLAFIAAAKKMH